MNVFDLIGMSFVLGFALLGWVVVGVLVFQEIRDVVRRRRAKTGGVRAEAPKTRTAPQQHFFCADSGSGFSRGGVIPADSPRPPGTLRDQVDAAPGTLFRGDLVAICPDCWTAAGVRTPLGEGFVHVAGCPKSTTIGEETAKLMVDDVAPAGTLFGLPVVIDDTLPPNPGWEIRPVGGGPKVIAWAGSVKTGRNLDADLPAIRKAIDLEDRANFYAAHDARRRETDV